jgi:hypothetical protein
MLGSGTGGIYFGSGLRMYDCSCVWRRKCADVEQCMTMGALLNQSMFLILMGMMKSKSVALIVQDFRNVSRD